MNKNAVIEPDFWHTGNSKNEYFHNLTDIKSNSRWRYQDDPTYISFDVWIVVPEVNEKPSYFML